MSNARAKSLPPPVGGWDALNALADMPPENAVQLDNWFPDADRVSVRRGYATHSTGYPGPVDSLMVYQPASGTARMFAASGAGIYNATGAGAVGSPVVTGRSNARFQTAQMTTAGGHFLLAVNGADTPQIYDGTTWADSTITGPTPANLVWINMHQRRLWMGETGTLRAWYLAPNAVTGAATFFDFTGLASLGGSLIGMGTWTRDGGSGADDLAAFVTDQGEVLLYAGTDPSSIATWGLVGVFRIGRPLGRRAMLRAGADLIIMTDLGFVSLSDVLPVDRVQQSGATISRQINPAVVTAARTYRANFGWQAFLYPGSNMAMFNVPAINGAFDQYVFNSITRAPCRFTNIPARCWGLLNEVPFFGAANSVCRFDTGTSDAGTNITASAVQAFNGFGSMAQKKLFRRCQVIMASDAPPSVGVDLALDYRTQAPMPAVSGAINTAALWDDAVWDAGLWSGEAIFDQWRGVRGVGRVAAVRVQSVSQTARPSWLATNVLAVPGGIL